MATVIQRGDKWQVKVRREGYPAISKTFSRKRDADAWAREQEREMDRGSWQDRGAAEATTFYSLVDRYLKDVVPGKRGADKEEARLKALMGDKIAKYKLSALTPLVLSEWRDGRLEAGVSGSTVNRELNIISAMLNWARRELMIAVENPVSAIKRPANGKARERRLEDGEEERLLAALEVAPKLGVTNKWMRPLVVFALETAMRRGELLSLTWENIDLAKRVAVLPITKNGDARSVPLSSRAVAVLNDLRAGKDGVKVLPTGRVFPMTGNAVLLSWVRAVKRAKIEGLTFHDLRHEATSRLAEKLTNLLELAAVTGHKDLRMLKRYYHPRAEDLAKKLG